MTTVRERIAAFIRNSKELQTQAKLPPSADVNFSLLTEQLIKYLNDDTWFAMHWDKDRRDMSDEPVHPRTHDGPGDIIAALGLGPAATVILSPVGEGSRGEAFAMEMEPGDIYIISGESRWEWRHGVSIDEEAIRDLKENADAPEDVPDARCTVVWRHVDVSIPAAAVGVGPG